VVDHHKLTADRVVPLLRGRFGRPYLWQDTCPSTQDVVRADPDLPEGAVAVTEHQTAGRGREGRRWEDVAGTSLLLSVVLRPPAVAPAEQLALVAGLAVAQAIEARGHRATVKWPNDVLVDGRKVAGVLLEASEGIVACGIGINVSQRGDQLPPETRVPAGSLAETLGCEPDRVTLLVDLLELLERLYDGWLAAGLEPLLPELERRDALRGHPVTVGDLTGTAAGIAPDGRLRISRPDGTEGLIASGEVHEESAPRG
jgi:BirA family biotin operon repressor/biotin-[acetyl-CoA-carboxylase] ligase